MIFLCMNPLACDPRGVASALILISFPELRRSILLAAWLRLRCMLLGTSIGAVACPRALMRAA